MKKEETGFGVISSLKFLGVYLKRYRLSFILFGVGWFLEGILQLMLPILFGILIDEMVYYRNIGTFLQVSLVILIFTLFLCSLYFVIYTFYNHIAGRYSFDIKMDLYDHLLRLKNEYVDETRAGDVITTIQTYTRECILIITRNLVYTVYCTLMIVLFSTYVWLVSWKIGLLFFLFVPVSTYITLKNGEISRSYSDRYRAEYGRFIGWLFEMLNGLKELKLLGAHSKIRQMFAGRHRPLIQLEIRKNLINLHLSNAVEFLNLCMLVSILGFGAYLTIRGDLTIGALIVVVSFLPKSKTTFCICTVIMWICRIGFRRSNTSRISRMLPVKKIPERNRWSCRAGRSSSETSGFPAPTPSYLTTCRSASAPARRWRSWARAEAGRRRWSTC